MGVSYCTGLEYEINEVNTRDSDSSGILECGDTMAEKELYKFGRGKKPYHLFFADLRRRRC
jgi:hypothetical protein